MIIQFSNRFPPCGLGAPSKFDLFEMIKKSGRGRQMGRTAGYPLNFNDHSRLGQPCVVHIFKHNPLPARIRASSWPTEEQLSSLVSSLVSLGCNRFGLLHFFRFFSRADNSTRAACEWTRDAMDEAHIEPI